MYQYQYLNLGSLKCTYWVQFFRVQLYIVGSPQIRLVYRHLLVRGANVNVLDSMCSTKLVKNEIVDLTGLKSDLNRLLFGIRNDSDVTDCV